MQYPKINYVKNRSYNQNKLNMTSHRVRQNWSIKDYLISWTWISCSVTFGNPLDLVRFRLQVMPELIQNLQLKQEYKGVIDCVKRVKLEEGLKGFWKGNFSNLLRILPNQTCIFELKQLFQRKYHYHHHLTPTKHFIINSLIGVTSGLIVATTLYPLQYARQLLSNKVQNTKGGIFHHLKTTVQVHGVLGLYKGLGIFLVGLVIFRGTYFGIYDSLKIKTDNEIYRWLISYYAMFMGMLVAYPNDTVRRRIVSNPHKYKGMLQCLKHIWSKQGPKGIFLGWQMLFLQSLTGCTFFFFYDRLFTDYREAKD